MRMQKCSKKEHLVHFQICELEQIHAPVKNRSRDLPRQCLPTEVLNNSINKIFQPRVPSIHTYNLDKCYVTIIEKITSFSTFKILSTQNSEKRGNLN
jgi:hypothetical protein